MTQSDIPGEASTGETGAVDHTGRHWQLDDRGLRHLLDELVDDADEVLGPVLDRGAVRLRPITTIDDLAEGVVVEEEAGQYEVRRTGSPIRFGAGPGPDSLKGIVHPPVSPVWSMRRDDGAIAVELAVHRTVRRAVVGVRACDLRALEVLARTQLAGDHPDAAFAARRRGLFVVAVDCTQAAPTCFCTSAGGGPAAQAGFDVALTELPSDVGGVTYVARAGSARGAELLDRIARPADAALVRSADAAVRRCADSMVRELPAEAPSIVDVPEHPRWDEVAERCLTCGNCTAVCPTCFCSDLRDEVSLDGTVATRRREWDSCFSRQYSVLAGRSHRSSSRSRYRQWLTHKLGTWHDQFGESGCVGCGRCITWCPVGIDLTAEVEALLHDDPEVAS